MIAFLHVHYLLTCQEPNRQSGTAQYLSMIAYRVFGRVLLPSLLGHESRCCVVADSRSCRLLLKRQTPCRASPHHPCLCAAQRVPGLASGGRKGDGKHARFCHQLAGHNSSACIDPWLIPLSRLPFLSRAGASCGSACGHSNGLSSPPRFTVDRIISLLPHVPTVHLPPLSNLSVLLRLPSVTPCFPPRVFRTTPLAVPPPRPCRLNVAMQENPYGPNH